MAALETSSTKVQRKVKIDTAYIARVMISMAQEAMKENAPQKADLLAAAKWASERFLSDSERARLPL